MDHYETLGVARDASADEIKKAYRRCSSKAHPDREGGSDARMAAVNRAYDVLSDPAKRERYDATGQDTPSGKTLEQMAEELVASWVSAAFDANVEPLAHANGEISRGHAKLDMDRSNAKVDLENLEKRAGKTRRKAEREGKTNLFERILQDKIRSKRALIERMDEAHEAQKLALAMLDEYETEEPPPPPKDTRTPLQKRQQAYADAMAMNEAAQSAFGYGGSQNRGGSFNPFGV